MLRLLANMANVCPICKCNLTYGHYGNTFNDISYKDFSYNGNTYLVIVTLLITLINATLQICFYLVL